MQQADWPSVVGARGTSILFYTLSACGAAAACFARARWLPAERRVAWLLLGAACLSWGMGGAAWAYQELWMQRGIAAPDRAIPFPSVADAGFLLLIPFAVAALLALVLGATQTTTRVRTFLDGLLITSALVFASWILFLGDIVRGTDALGDTARVIALSYPVGDIFLFGLLLLVASRSVPQVRRTLLFLAGVIVAWTIADVGFWQQVATGGGTTGNWTDLGWPAGFLLIVFTALRPVPVILNRDAAPPGLWLSALPLAPFVVSTGLAMVVQVQEGALPPFLFWNAIVVVGVLAIRQFVMVYENVVLRREAEASLDRLREAEALRTRLLHTITHDLQNPLTPIQIQLRLLQAGPQDIERRLAIVGRNVEQIKRLVSDLADVSKLQDGRLTIVRQPMDLAVIVRDVGDSFRPLAAERGIGFECDANDALPVEGDAIRLRQVIANLVSNALKFTPGGGLVRQSTRTEDTHVAVDVADSGRGLSPEEAARLFQPFSQVHKPDEARERGTGLGLFISRGLAEAHGGTLTVSSPGLGKGSTFTLRLPRRTDPLPDTVDIAR